MRHLIPASILLGAITAAAQQPIPLRDGQVVTLAGTLTMQPGGRLQFVALRTADAYQPVVQDGSAAPTHDIGLSGYFRYDLLYAHRGQAVTATGRVMTDSASPYYLHNVSLKATSIRLANGTELLGKPRVMQPIAADVGQYQAAVSLPEDLAAPWRYTAHGQPDPEERFLSCSSNGGGDVVNCFCGKGFHPTGANVASGNTRLIAQRMDDLVQTDVGDDAKGVTIAVTCSR